MAIPERPILDPGGLSSLQNSFPSSWACRLSVAQSAIAKMTKMAREDSPTPPSVHFLDGPQTRIDVADKTALDQDDQEPASYIRSSAWTRTGIIATVSLVIGTTTLAACIGFLYFLWYGTPANALWYRIVADNWASPTITLTAAVCRYPFYVVWKATPGQSASSTLRISGPNEITPPLFRSMRGHSARAFQPCKKISHMLSERRGFRGPGHLVSGADWIPGTASTPVSLSH